MVDSSQPYRVLARKYRPQRFSELLGQEAMVRTLGNAIKRDRLAHAFLMTGVRGVGKTSTARLIAKALNCVGPDGQGGPTIDPCGVCEPCVAIAEGRHIDVVEMDAASNTGVDDVREIIEAVRYAAVSARYKIYIVDEVHMLTKNAFNALLKTLEEPPPHVKFLFATTELNKVPVTILSRCQRFDLRRIPAELLQSHFAHVVETEGVRAEPAALALIAHAAEGSARDGLSILDQAIAHAEDEGGTPLVRADHVRDMLGLADRGGLVRLLDQVLDGRTDELLDGVRGQYALGTDPVSIMRGFMELIHATTLVKAGKRLDDPSRSEQERAALTRWADALGFGDLHRLWQLLLKGHGDVAHAAMPIETCEMALLRLVHAASLPDPSELARLLQGGAPATGAGVAPGGPVTPSSGPVAQGAPAEPGLPADFASFVDWLKARGDVRAYTELHDNYAVIDYAPPALVLKRVLGAEDGYIRELADHLTRTTGRRWSISLGEGEAQPTLWQQEDARRQAREAAIMGSAPVQRVLATFPDARLIGVDED